MTYENPAPTRGELAAEDNAARYRREASTMERDALALWLERSLTLCDQLAARDFTRRRPLTDAERAVNVGPRPALEAAAVAAALAADVAHLAYVFTPKEVQR